MKRFVDFFSKITFSSTNESFLQISPYLCIGNQVPTQVRPNSDPSRAPLTILSYFHYYQQTKFF